MVNAIAPQPVMHQVFLKEGRALALPFHRKIAEWDVIKGQDTIAGWKKEDAIALI
ncbi:MAG: hypothetical protein AAGD25_32000 [Cyanobacteria bacterium P01_F01_bin.150]